MPLVQQYKWLPEYQGIKWLVSTSQYLTFFFWIVASTALEILSNISAFATQGLPEDQWFLRRPDFYCLDASFETASGIISVFNILEIISHDKQILTFYPLLVPYI